MTSTKRRQSYSLPAFPCWYLSWENSARAYSQVAILSHLPPYSVEVCTTIGAGDGFASGFLYAMLKGLPVAECLHYGNARQPSW